VDHVRTARPRWSAPAIRGRRAPIPSEGPFMLKGFRDFIARGNVVDLAVAVVIGAAFKTIIDAILAGLINPLIAAIFGKPNLDSVGTFTINNSQFSIGLILTAIINFVAVAAAIYFVVVVPMNEFRKRYQTPAEATEEKANEEVELLREIRDSLRAGGRPTP
jgi:large conductance mechanosensitive channel